MLKDVSTGKYIDANATHLSVYGFNKAEEIIGLDIWELNNQMQDKWEDNAHQVDRLDKQVIYTRKSVVAPQRVWLNSKGFVWTHCLRKIPIIGCHNKVTAILSTGEEQTHLLPLCTLYKYYNHFYKNKKQAITKFLEHIGISSYFYQLPNHTEVMILISRAQNYQNKLIAHDLNYQLSTVQSYINQLSRKTTDLEKILCIMRAW